MAFTLQKPASQDTNTEEKPDKALDPNAQQAVQGAMAGFKKPAAAPENQYDVAPLASNPTQTLNSGYTNYQSAAKTIKDPKIANPSAPQTFQGSQAVKDQFANPNSEDAVLTGQQDNSYHPADRGGKFVNFSQILNANQDKSRALGNNIVNKTRALGATAKGAYESANSKVNAEISAGMPKNYDSIDSSMDNLEGGVGQGGEYGENGKNTVTNVGQAYRDALAKFSNQNPAYTGPGDSQSYYQAANQAVGDLKGQLATTQSPEALQASLQQQFQQQNPGYSNANSQLDAALLGATNGNQIDTLAKKYSGIDKLIANSQVDAEGRIKQGQDQAAQEKQQIEDVTRGENARLGRNDAEQQQFVGDGPDIDPDIGKVRALPPDQFLLYKGLFDKVKSLQASSGAGTPEWKDAVRQLAGWRRDHGMSEGPYHMVRDEAGSGDNFNGGVSGGF